MKPRISLLHSSELKKLHRKRLKKRLLQRLLHRILLKGKTGRQQWHLHLLHHPTRRSRLQLSFCRFRPTTLQQQLRATTKLIQRRHCRYLHTVRCYSRCVGYGVCPIDVLQEHKEKLEKASTEKQLVAAEKENTAKEEELNVPPHCCVLFQVCVL